jgi:hypothetical protein
MENDMEILKKDKDQMIKLFQANPRWLEDGFRDMCCAEVACKDCVMSKVRMEETNVKKKRTAGCNIFFKEYLNKLDIVDQFEIKIEAMEV